MPRPRRPGSTLPNCMAGTTNVVLEGLSAGLKLMGGRSAAVVLRAAALLVTLLAVALLVAALLVAASSCWALSSLAL